MVESNPSAALNSAEEAKNAADGTAQRTVFPESVNVPLMASLKLSTILLDPDIGKSYATKYEVKE